MDMKSILSYLLLLQAIINFANAQTQHICRNTGDFRNKTLLESRDEAFNGAYTCFQKKPYDGFCHVQGGIRKWEIKVNVIILCPPNIKPEACVDCLKKTVPFLKQKCPMQKEAIAWTSLPGVSCMARYASDRSIYMELDDWAWVNFASPNGGANVGDLEKALGNLVTNLQELAAADGGSNKKFASGSVAYGGPGSRKFLTGDMQCTPEISKEQCMRCLSKASKEISSCCASKGKTFAKMFSTNCFIRYSL